MLRRSQKVNPIVLVSLVIVLILSFGIFASAQLGAGTAGDALSVGEAQMGKPFKMATDGPDTFSCSGLMRYIMRTIGVDGDAPWVPEGYLSKYAPVNPANLQPGDIVIYPDWATMYAGNGMLLNANEDLGHVTETPMSVAGTPEGIVRPPYSGQPQGGATQRPAQPLAGADQYGATQPLAGTTQYGSTQPQGGAIDPPPTQPLAGASQYAAPQLLNAAPVQQQLPAGATQYQSPMTSPAPEQPVNEGVAPQPSDGVPVQPPDGTPTQF